MDTRRGIVTLIGAVAIVLSSAGGVSAADAVPTVEVSGTVVGPEGTVVPVERAQLYEYESEGADPIRTDIVVAEDGTFTVALRAWGTADAPARIQILAEGEFGEEEVDADGCVTVRWPTGSLEMEIPGVVPVEPIIVVMDEESSIGACTATPAPTRDAPEAPEAPEAPVITLPPTDAGGTPGLPGATIAWLGLVLLGLSAAALLLKPRRARTR